MKEIIRTLKPYIPEEPAAAVKERLGVDRLVRLSANENPYGTSPLVREAILSYVTHNDANYYPDGNATDLRLKLAEYWKVQPEQLVIGVGLDEVIAMVNKTLISALVKAVDETTRLVWICNPNNPTGTYESVEDIRKFIAAIPKETLVIIDEAYIDFVTAVAVPTARALLDEFPNVAIMRTFSKAYGLANYRVGYMMTPVELANYMQTIRLPYNLNTLSQVAAEAAFEDQAFLRRTVSQNAEERAKWESLFDELNIHYYKSEANFIFFTVPDAEGLADAWLKEGYQVRRGQRNGWLRLTIPMAQDGAVMRGILKEFMN